MKDTKAESNKIIVKPAESYIYASVFLIDVTPYDFRISAADTVTQPGKDYAGVRTVAGLVMSPEAAAQLSALLARRVKAFECTCGPIRRVPGTREHLDE